jgi:nicotinate-nucleotide adenylyltransferase
MMFAPPSLYDQARWRHLKIGLLGGSFNPAHIGHRAMSLYALSHLQLDFIWWLVAPHNPLKAKSEMAAYDRRLESARKIAAHPRIIVSNIEILMQTVYTADSLDKLRFYYPETRFVWLMGSDNLQTIHRWQRWDDIFKRTPIGVFNRPPRENTVKACLASRRFKNALIPEKHAKILPDCDGYAWTILHVPLNPLSSTLLRQQGDWKP